MKISKSLLQRLNAIPNRFCVCRNLQQAPRKFFSGLSYSVLENSSNNPPILMAHGVLGNKNNFNSVSKKLAQSTGRSVITYDARNHGKSPHFDQMTLLDMSNDATKLLDLLNIEKCVFVGHSMGARTAMFTALTQPSRIDKLVVVDSSPRLSNVKGGGATTLHYLKAMRAVVFDCSGSLSNARRNTDKQLQEFIPESSLRQFILTNVEEKETGLYGWRVNLDAIYEHIEQPRHIKLTDDMRPYLGDTLFLGGGSSQFLRMDDYPYIKYLFPNCVISYVPECGHWVHSEKPVEFLSSVTSFLKPPQSFFLFEENTT